MKIMKMNKPTIKTRKFYIKGHNNKVDSTETGCIVIARSPP